MGYIKEPKGVDLIIEPSILTKEDREQISSIIAAYKRTGKKPVTQKHSILSASTNSRMRKKRTMA